MPPVPPIRYPTAMNSPVIPASRMKVFIVFIVSYLRSGLLTSTHGDQPDFWRALLCLPTALM